MPNGTNTPVSHIILYELITACFFFGKLALKSTFFEVHTLKFADPSPSIFH